MPMQSRVLTGNGAQTGASGTRVYRETPAGVINGANDSFTTAAAFENGKETVSYNGLDQLSGVGSDYVASESGGVGTGYDTITFAIPPRSGDNLLVDYTPA